MKTKAMVRILNAVLCLILLFPMTLAAEGKTDYEGHYGEESIKKLFEKGVITGYEDGSFKPDREISRAEFMTIVNRAFDFKEQAKISFSDVTKDQWHYEQIAKAVKAGYIKGFTDGTMRPTANITRQEAAVIIARILDIEKDGDIKKLTTLKDGDKVPQWSAKGVAAIVERNYIELKENNQFQPTQNLTRADMAIAIVKSQEETIAKLYAKPGIYTGGKIDGNVKIDNKGITLINTEISGDLILGEGIGDGDIRLTNITVKGDTIVKGGGKNTIVLENCQFEKIIILKEDGKIRILAKGNTTINQSEVKSGAILESQGKAGESFGYITIAGDIREDSIVELIGNFKAIEVIGDGIEIKASGGTIENLTIAKGTKDVEIDLAKGAKVAALIIDSPAKITGTGKIDKATVNAQGVKIEAPVTKVETAPDIKVDTPKKETAPATGGGGGGGGGGSSSSGGSGNSSTPAKTEVNAISVKGTSDVDEITTKNGTLQMVATVSPATASNKAVTWNVSDTSIATINSSGLLTAKANGIVKVTATAKDGSNVTGAATITISGQTVTPPLSDAKVITSFKFESLTPVVIGVIDETAKTITLTVPYETNLTALVPTIVHTGDSISPTDGSRDFTNPVIYTVAAENGTTAKYTVTVNIAPAGSHILTYVAEAGGTITGTSPQTVTNGGDGTAVTAVPNEGYSFLKWSDGKTDATRKDTNVTTSETYTAIFKSDIKTVGFESLTANGTSGTTTTTVLYVKFDQAIPGLSPENITLEGATLKLLSMSSTSNECSITIKDIEVKNGENVKVTINKAGYLFTPTSKEVEVYVANIQAEINPTSAVFDKKNPENVETNIDFGTATKIESIKKGDIALTEGNDYTVSGNTLTIKKEYLLAQPVGTAKLDIAFDQGYTREFSINIKNEGTYSIVVKEITGGFGGETAAAHKGSDTIEEAKEGDHITISIADLTGTYEAWKVKSAKFKDDNGVETNLNTANKRTHSFTMPASNVTVIIELEPEEDLVLPTISDSKITANRITDISLTLNWDKATDNLTPEGYLKYYVYQSELNNIGSVAGAESNGTLLNAGGTYILKNLNVKDLGPDKTYYFNVVVADYAGNKTAYTTKEVKTLKAITDLDLTSKVTKPVKYGKINFTFAAGEQYSSTNAINWWKKEGDTETQVYISFDPDTVYIAKVNLTAKDGYSFNASTVFTYTGATDVSFKVNNNDPKGGSLTITFPATEAVTKYTLTLDGDGLTSNPSESQIAENTKVTVTVKPKDGEQVVSFTVNGVEEKQRLENNKYTFTITQDTIIKVTYSDEYALTSSGDNVVEFKVAGSPVTTAKKGDIVTMLVTPGEGKELIGATLTGINKESVTEDEVGKEYTFTMPNNDVNANITVGEPNKKLSINPGKIGGGHITLLNGELKWSNNTIIEGLTWSYFTNTITMNNFTANYLGRISGEAFQFDLELIGASTINSGYMAALDFSETVNIKGDGTLNIGNIYAYDYVVKGIGLISTMNRINLKDQASIQVMVENTKKQNGVAISNVMPFIGNGVAAYKGTAVWSAGDGDSAEKPIEITYHVAKGTELKGENIYIGNIVVTDLRSGGFDGTTINAVETISFDANNQTIVFAKHSEKYYKIIIKEDTPIADFKNTKVTDTTVSFTWTAAIGATGVKIQQSFQGENDWKDATTQAELTPESTSATITGLTPSTDYDFKLVVTGGENQGDTEVIGVKTLEVTDAQKTVNAEADKYKTTAEISKDVGVGDNITSTIVELLEGETADGSIELSYAISSNGTYLEISDGAIKLKAQKISEGDAKETVTVTFKIGDETATKEVEVTIKSSNKKLIKIDGEEKELTEELPEGLSWNDDTKILTMDGYNGGAIHTNFEAGYELKKLKINETNTITVNDESSTKPVIGFGTKDQLSITGSGTLTIDVKTKKSRETIGLYNGYYVEDKTQGTGSSGMSSISIASGVTLNIDVESQTGPSSAIKASTLTLNGGTVNFASKSNSGTADGIDVVSLVYHSGTIEIADKGIFVDSTGYPIFSRETPYVKSYKATKITDLTWDSEKNATEEGKAVEYSIYLKSDTAELTVNDIAVVLNESMTLEVYSDDDFSTKWIGENITFDEDKTEATIYVKATRDSINRYFKINLVKETP